jgi:hypothetical protein
MKYDRILIVIKYYIGGMKDGIVRNPVMQDDGTGRDL